jgi:hypothetical protein
MLQGSLNRRFIGEAPGEYDGVLDRLTPTLTQVWRHWVGRVPDEGDSPPYEVSGRGAVIDVIDRDFFALHEFQQLCYWCVPARKLGLQESNLIGQQQSLSFLHAHGLRHVGVIFAHGRGKKELSVGGGQPTISYETRIGDNCPPACNACVPRRTGISYRRTDSRTYSVTTYYCIGSEP